MATGLGLLGFTPPVLWAMTPRELDAAIRGRLGISSQSAPLSGRDLAELMQRYPDRL